MSQLKGLRVLVTRPEGRAEPLLEAIGVAGGEALHLPMMEIAPLTAEGTDGLQQRQIVLELDQYQQLIFISVNAVHCGLDMIEDYWPLFPAKLAIHAIGAATAAALQQRGLAVCSENPAMNSEGLLAQPGLQDVSGERVLIIKGEGGRETLASVLGERGARVDTLSCYCRLCPAAAGQAERVAAFCPDVLCFNSAETLSNFRRLCPDSALLDRVVVVPSARVADTAQQSGFSRVVTAANAGTAATLTALQAIAENRNL